MGTGRREMCSVIRWLPGFASHLRTRDACPRRSCPVRHAALRRDGRRPSSGSKGLPMAVPGMAGIRGDLSRGDLQGGDSSLIDLRRRPGPRLILQSGGPALFAAVPSCWRRSRQPIPSAVKPLPSGPSPRPAARPAFGARHEGFSAVLVPQVRIAGLRVEPGHSVPFSRFCP